MISLSGILPGITLYSQRVSYHGLLLSFWTAYSGARGNCAGASFTHSRSLEVLGSRSESSKANFPGVSGVGCLGHWVG